MKKVIIMLSAAFIIFAGCGKKEVSTEKVSELKVLVGWGAKDPNGNDPEIKAVRDKVEAMTGQKVKYLMNPVDGGDEKLLLDLGSGADYDMVYLNPSNYGKLYSQKALLDLKPFLEKYGKKIMEEIPAKHWETVTDPSTGAIYGIPRISQSTSLIANIAIRKDILEKEKLPIPTTIKEMLDESLELAKRGYSQPLSPFWGAADARTIRGSFDVVQDWNLDKNGNLISANQDDRYLEFLKFWREAYKGKALGKDFETLKYDQAFERFIKGDTVFLPCYRWHFGDLQKGLALQNKSVYRDVEILYGLKGYNGEKGTTSQAGDMVDDILAIPAYKSNTAPASIAYLNRLIEDDVQTLFNFGVEGEEWIKDEKGNKNNWIVEADGTIKVLARKYGPGQLVSSPKQLIESNEQGIRMATPEIIEGFAKIDDSYNWSTSKGYAANGTEFKYGVKDPQGMAINLSSVAKIKGKLYKELEEFTNLYIAGQVNDSDWVKFKERMNSEYELDKVTKEFNEWYQNLQKKK